VGEDDCAGGVEKGAHFSGVHDSWFFYLARICNHCTYPACLSSCPRGAIYKRPEDGIVLIDQGRCRGYQECIKACPYKKTFYNAMTGTSEKCIACFPKIEMGMQPQCFVNCIGKIRCAGWISKPENAKRDNPIDFLVHVKKVALPLFPQFGLEPNVYYIPPVNVPRDFLLQMFGPNIDAALETYRNAPRDKDLSGLLTLFGSTERIIHRFKRRGETMYGYDDRGNLTLVTFSLGTPYAIETRGKVLFLEEVNEEPYRIDRMLTQLVLSGRLDGVRGIVVGEMVGCRARTYVPGCSAAGVVARFARDLDIPCFATFPSGHGRENVVLPMGGRIVLEAEGQESARFHLAV